MLFYRAEEVNIEWVFFNNHLFFRSNIVFLAAFIKIIDSLLSVLISVMSEVKFKPKKIPIKEIGLS